MILGGSRDFQIPVMINHPRLYPWGPRTLYLGPAQNLSPHRNAVACLAIGLEAGFEVSDDPQDVAASYRSCRSVLVHPNTLHHFRGATGLMAFLYLDPQSRDLDRLRQLMRIKDMRASFGLANEDRLADALLALWRSEADWPETRRVLGREFLGVSAGVDDRIKSVLGRMSADPAGRLSAGELAQAVGLSESRFLHLFSETVGLPFRRYRLWCSMGAALRSVTQGASLTTAALDAGFSSSAHFSTAFREMFGMEPSRLSRAGIKMRKRASDSARSVRPVRRSDPDAD